MRSEQCILCLGVASEEAIEIKFHDGIKVNTTQWACNTCPNTWSDSRQQAHCDHELKLKLRSRIAILVEGLRFYSNIVDDLEIKTDGFFVKRPCDEKWFAIQNKARQALTEAGIEEGK